jgi:hypothetical protein
MLRSEWTRPIPQTPEERTKAIELSVTRAIANGREWRCPLGCGFHRSAETKGGVLRVAAKHLHLEHRIRLEFR